MTTSIYNPPPEFPDLSPTDPGLLRAVAIGQARLAPQQALDLLRAAPTQTLGRHADAKCRHIHGDSIRTYVIDRNINYTNVCSAKCTFCAFRRDATDHDAYTLDTNNILDKIAELADIGGTQILMQGGMNPDLPLDWYLNLLSTIKVRFPKIHIHAFSPPEFIEFVNFFSPPGNNLEQQIRWVMTKLREAGLDSLPGGGGEIFAEPVRRKIGLGKCDAEAWLTCMYVAHTLGMFTSATMMFGHIEGLADRVHHMLLVRKWQDRALLETSTREEPTGHYKAFISWPFQRENTPLGRVKDWPINQQERQEGFPGDLVANLTGDGDPKPHKEFGRRVRRSSATDYLRTQALSRLVLDNIYSIGASWVTMGPHIGQLGLAYGANDMGSVMMEENVVSSAGTTYCLDQAVLCRLIRDAGFTPAQRNNSYDVIHAHPAGPGSPDGDVADWSTHRAQRLHIQSNAEKTSSATTPANQPVNMTISASDQPQPAIR